MALVDQRDLHHRGAELLGEHRVRLERRPGEQHLVAGIAGGGHGHAAQLHRPVGEQDLLGRHRAVGAQGFTQRGGAVVGIAVGATGRGFDRLQGRRQRSERRLVRRQLDDVADGVLRRHRLRRAAGHVLRHEIQGGPSSDHLDTLAPWVGDLGHSTTQRGQIHGIFQVCGACCAMSGRHFLHAQRRDEAGFTLAEVVIAVTILGVVAAALAGAFLVTAHDSVGIAERFAASHDAQITSAYLATDVQSSTAVAAPSCSSGSGVIGFRYNDGSIASYCYGSGTLTRQYNGSPVANVPLIKKGGVAPTATCTNPSGCRGWKHAHEGQHRFLRE